MKFLLIILVAVLRCRNVASLFIGRTVSEDVATQDYHIPVKIDPIKSGHIEQDIWGRYSYNFETPKSTRYEVREENGAVIGGYSFYDENGILQLVSYKADSENGFQVTRSEYKPESSTVLDKPRSLENQPRELNDEREIVVVEKITPIEKETVLSVTDTPEVLSARLAFEDYQRATIERNNLLKANDNILNYSPFSGTIPLYDEYGVITPTGYAYEIEDKN